MLKYLIITFSLIHLMHCSSVRSNIWWNRRNDNSHRDCKLDFDNKNPSIEEKICGYCFAKCQQQFATCLLVELHHVLPSSLEHCYNLSEVCEVRCLNDKQTSRIAKVNWPKVFKILQQYVSPK